MYKIYKIKRKKTPQIHCGSNPRPCTKPTHCFHRKQLIPRQGKERTGRALRLPRTPHTDRVPRGEGASPLPKAVHVVRQARCTRLKLMEAGLTEVFNGVSKTAVGKRGLTRQTSLCQLQLLTGCRYECAITEPSRPTRTWVLTVAVFLEKGLNSGPMWGTRGSSSRTHSTSLSPSATGYMVPLTTPHPVRITSLAWMVS